MQIVETSNMNQNCPSPGSPPPSRIGGHSWGAGARHRTYEATSQTRRTTFAAPTSLAREKFLETRFSLRSPFHEARRCDRVPHRCCGTDRRVTTPPTDWERVVEALPISLR